MKHVEIGSHQQTNCVSCTEGALNIAAALASASIVDSTPGGIVVSFLAENVWDAGGVLVRISASKLLERDANARSAAYAAKLREVLLMSETGINTHMVAIDNGVLVGNLGDESDVSGKTDWDRSINKDSVVCTTGFGTALSAPQLGMLGKLGGCYKPHFVKSMTLLVSRLQGVKGTTKSKWAAEQGIPVVSVGCFAERLVELTGKSLDIAH